MSSFIHLRSSTSCSMLESALRISAMMQYCQQYQTPAIALCDHHNMFAAVEFTQNAMTCGVQPILGITLDIALSDVEIPASHVPCASVALLAQNSQGYKNLCHLSSQYYLQGRMPISLEKLCAHHQGLILLTGGASGFLGQQIMMQQAATKNLRQLAEAFTDRLYIELTRHQTVVEKKLESAMLDLAYRYQLPIVATNHCYYAERNHHLAYAVLRGIATGKTGILENESKQGEYYLKSPEQMQNLFRDLPEAIENTVFIAQRCHFLLEDKSVTLPKYHGLDGKSEREFITQISNSGLEHRLNHEVLPKHAKKNYPMIVENYRLRLDYELGIIIDKGFADYFLIVADFIRWAKKQNIPVGPGRGSGAGSLVAWVLQITDLDPIRWGLLFERFLNPERMSMPDFDIDFCQDRRNEVIEYVRDIYGQDRVAQIITFGSLKPRACVRDVGRVMGLPYGLVDRISKLIPDFTSQIAPLLQGKYAIEALVNMRDQQGEVKTLLELSTELEGLYRHASTHAAGIVIANQPLEEIVPLYHDGSDASLPATQFNMKHIERTGLVKFDFLGLRTLSVIHATMAMVADTKNIMIDINQIPLDAKPVYHMLARGDSFGVFQLESTGMRDVLRNMQPNRFEDLIAAVALYRPGPMENIPLYNARKNGHQQVKYLHPLLESILAETYGIPVYQEQVMQMAEKLANYSLGNADKLRRAMGKKNQEEMKAEREFFIAGAQQTHHISKTKAQEIFNEMEAFAGYGFNKSHAAAYALVSYQTAWLKQFHPLEYYAVMLSYEMQNTTKIAQYKNTMQQQGIVFLSPDINQSQVGFSLGEQVNSLRYALAALKNVGSDIVQAMINNRDQGGDYASLVDFAARNCELKLNRRMLETMVKAGAFDQLTAHRAQAFEAIDVILGHAATCFSEQNSMQNNLFFDSETAKPPPPILPEVSAWGHHEMLKHEMEAIGFYLSDHPLSPYREVITSLGITEAKDLASCKGGTIALVGIASNIRKIRTKTGKRMAFVEFSDLSGIFELAFFEEQLTEAQLLLDGQQPLLIKAETYLNKSLQNEESLRLRLKHIELLDANLTQAIMQVRLCFTGQEWLATISEILQDFSKQGLGKIELQFPIDNRLVTLALSGRYNLSPGLIKALKALEGVRVGIG